MTSLISGTTNGGGYFVWLRCGYNIVTRLDPSLNATLENHDILESFFNVLGRQTDGTGIAMSASVEDDFSVHLKLRDFRLQFI